MVKNKALPDCARLCTPRLVTRSLSLSPSLADLALSRLVSRVFSLSRRRRSSWGYPLDLAGAGPRQYVSELWPGPVLFQPGNSLSTEKAHFKGAHSVGTTRWVGFASVTGPLRLTTGPRPHWAWPQWGQGWPSDQQSHGEVLPIMKQHWEISSACLYDGTVQTSPLISLANVVPDNRLALNHLLAEWGGIYEITNTCGCTWMNVIAWVEVQFSRSVMSDSLWSNALQHIRPPCPSPTPRAYSNSCLGAGIRMGNTCKSMANSCQCIAKTTTILQSN